MAEQVAVNPAAEGAAGGSEEEVATGEQGAGPAGESIANAADPDAAIEAEEGEAEPEAPKRRKLKLGDKEIEFDEDVAALIDERNQVYEKRKEHTRAANERFQKAAEVFKMVDGLDPKALEALRSGDPFQVARALGKDPDALVTDYAKQKLAEMDMSPEQRQFADQQRALETRAKAVQEQEQKIQQHQYQQEIQRVQADFAKHLPGALEKFNLPDDEFTAGEMGKIIAQQVRLTGRPPTQAEYEEAAEVQAERLETQLTRYLDRLARTPGALKKKFPEIAKRLREEDVASVGAPRAVRPGKPQNAPQPQPSRAPKTYAEEEAEFRRRKFEALNNGGRSL
jgi:hypothetical protein